LEKKKEEARKRTEHETRELLEKKRKKLLAEKQNEPKPSIKKPSPTSKPSGSSNQNAKTQTKASTQPTKTTSSSSKPSSSKKTSASNQSKPSSSKSQPQKPTMSYQDILKLADQNKDKPKALSDAAKPKDATAAPKVSKPGAEPSTSATASSSGSSSKLTPEQIAKLKEKQKKPNVVPAQPKAPVRTDINNNKNKPIEKPSAKNIVEQKTKPSQSAWDRIMSDMKKGTPKSMFIVCNFRSYLI
jgi:hypothetical protein